MVGKSDVNRTENPMLGIKWPYSNILSVGIETSGTSIDKQMKWWYSIIRGKRQPFAAYFGRLYETGIR